MLLPLLLLLLLSCVAILLLLLSAAVRHRVPDSQICCRFIESDPSVFFLLIQKRFIFDGTPWQYCCVAFTASISPASSVIVYMRGAKAGVSPPRQSAPLYYDGIVVVHAYKILYSYYICFEVYNRSDLHLWWQHLALIILKLGMIKVACQPGVQKQM